MRLDFGYTYRGSTKVSFVAVVLIVTRTPSSDRQSSGISKNNAMLMKGQGASGGPHALSALR
jgi:hypothetical protein